MAGTGKQWWRDAVIYQVYPRSWADSDGDGIGDLPGITARLPHLAELGVDAVWLSPFYTSPQHDAGYDVADYRDVDPLFGHLDAFDALTARAHELGLRVVVDVVPNHSSDEHVWFRAALASAPGSLERARYVFRDGSGPDGDEPPNNWTSMFGGPAWTRVTEADGTPGQWFLHLFDSTQPDFDWTNPEVRDELEGVLRFWLDRGVDGFRIDVAHGLVKAEGLPDTDLSLDPNVDATSLSPMWDQPGVHEIYRSWRLLADSYAVEGDDADRILCAEAWVLPGESLAKYVRPDELHQSFNFEYLMTPWRADDQRSTITRSLAQAEAVGAPQTWVLSNHDVVRHATRLGYPQHAGLQRIEGIGADDPQPDAALGLRRARAATAVMLALPGSAYLFQGEELGLPEATRLPDEVRQDPTFARTGGSSKGRDGCRVPVPWEAAAPSFGFGPGEASWLPQPAEYGALAVDCQRDDPTSTLTLYRDLLRLRRELRLGRGRLTWLDGHPADVLAFTISSDEAAVTVLANLGVEPLPLPDGATVVAASGEREHGAPVDTDETVWLRA
ncbi:glycoside hydrolase family 13 protein [Aeromicrobium stalagmiti]|uniref:glycoside hydrolase family 13 protein n=1 Tax=Aeromicrobium stalagmiti TaxID=2738988 RepID=UPI001568A518|nr:glycoside hydrolase family 13 protein [Aeromicrobium stalagmiti]NRQ51235.1 glycoside hydrolase family 13 protein [Aeromicrobium stalagmiti]